MSLSLHDETVQMSRVKEPYTFVILLNASMRQHSPVGVTKRSHDVSQYLLIVYDIIVGQEHLVYLAGCRCSDLWTRETPDMMKELTNIISSDP